MAEQDRKLAEQERKMAEAGRSKSDDKQQSSDKQSEQEERIAKLELNLAEARKPPDPRPPPGPGRMPVKKNDSAAAAAEAEGTEEAEEEEDQKFTGAREATGSSAQDPGDAEDEPFEDHAEVDIPGAVSINGRAGEYEAHEDELEETLKEVKTEVRYIESREPV